MEHFFKSDGTGPLDACNTIPCSEKVCTVAIHLLREAKVLAKGVYQKRLDRFESLPVWQIVDWRADAVPILHMYIWHCYEYE